MASLVLVFCGMGYNSDKPLLYYSRYLAKEKGFEKSVVLEYRDLPDLNSVGLEAVFQEALRQSREMTKDIDWQSYDRILFLSKSVGTYCAAMLARDISQKVEQVYFTPLNQSLEAAEEKGLVFIGTRDPFADVERMKEQAKEKNMEIHVYENADHSLRSNDVVTDTKRLHEMMQIFSDHLK